MITAVQAVSRVKRFFRLEKFLPQPSQDFVGLNLGNYYLKGLIVNKGQIVDYFIEKNEDLLNTINKIWEKKKIIAKTIKISLKNPACLVRYFPFPKMDAKKIKQALFYELQKFVPFSYDEVYFDFSVLKEINPKEVFILLAVAKKDFLNQILTTFKQANLKLTEINLDSICLANLFLNNYEQATKVNACILDIGHSFSTINILNKGIPFLTRDVKFNTKDIFQIVSRTKEVEVSKVENWLRSLKDNNEFLELIPESISSACKEIKNSFDYFEVNRAESIDKVYLSGGFASLEGIRQTFAEGLDAEVDILGIPFGAKRELTDSPFSRDEEFNFFKNSFSVVFGLVL